MPCPWEHSSPGWTGLWATWSDWRCPCSWQGGGAGWPFKVLKPKPFCDSMLQRNMHDPRDWMLIFLPCTWSADTCSWCGPSVSWVIHVMALALRTCLPGPITISVPPVASTSERMGEKSTWVQRLSKLISSPAVFIVGFVRVGLSDHQYWRERFIWKKGFVISTSWRQPSHIGCLSGKIESVPTTGHNSPQFKEWNRLGQQ